MTTIFVFGSNRCGWHGAGAARHALDHCGARYGQAEGRQGNSYAIVTLELRPGKRPVDLVEIETGVRRFLRYARRFRNLTFDLTPIGCGLAGFRPEQIAPMFRGAPANVLLPPEFRRVLDDLEIPF